MMKSEENIKLSVVILTYNEEKNIQRCIESVLDIADEIVVVDSFSTDDTKQICSNYPNIKFIEHKFEGYIEQKNYALTQASNDYIFSLDADEAPDKILIESIKGIKNNWQSPGYSMNRFTNYCGKWIKHCGWYPDVKLRIFDRRLGSWTGINPHDVYMFSDSDMQPIHLKGDILHYSYYSISQHIQQVDNFTNINSREAFNKGKNVSVFGIVFRTVWKFFRDYIIKLGILDGYYGFVISAISSFATFSKYVKLKELNKTKQLKS